MWENPEVILNLFKKVSQDEAKFSATKADQTVFRKQSANIIGNSPTTSIEYESLTLNSSAANETFI